MCNKVFEEAAKRDKEFKEKDKEDRLMDNKESLIVTPLSECEGSVAESKEDEFIEPDEDRDEYEEEVERVTEKDVEKVENKCVNECTTGEKLIIAPIGGDEGVKITKNVKDPLEAIDNAIQESGIKNMLTDDEEEVVDNFIKNSKVSESVNSNASQVKVTKTSENESTAEMAIGVLDKFKKYITSEKFDKACESSAKKHGVKKNIVKNKMISGFLGTIADTLGLTISIAGDIILGAVGFISTIIEKIVEFAVDSLLKLVSVLTLNCGDVVNS